MTTTAIDEISVEEFLAKFRITEQSKMKAVIAATKGSDPHTGLQKLFDFQKIATGTMRCHYLPQKMQRELLDLCKSCDRSIPTFFSRKIGLVFQKYYGDKIKLPTLVQKVNKCSWPAYEAVLSHARKWGFLVQDVQASIIPLMAGRVKVVLLAHESDERSLRLTSVIKRLPSTMACAVFMQNLPMEAASEGRARAGVGLKKDDLLFGLESPQRQCLEFFQTLYFEALCLKNKMPANLKPSGLSRAFFELLYSNRDFRAVWDGFKPASNECFAIYQQCDALVKKSSKSSDIDPLDFSSANGVELLRSLFEAAIQKYRRELPPDELQDFCDFLKTPTLAIREMYCTLDTSRKSDELARNLLNATVELNIQRIALIKAGYLSTVKRGIEKVLEEQFNAWNNPKPKLESKVESKAESKGDAKAASSAGAAEPSTS
ncbi:MAG: hypothetical protein HYX48_07360 [Chlamydiales bacterium]|nr:hypothetical protein [Chlamydiales bacterium]